MPSTIVHLIQGISTPRVRISILIPADTAAPATLKTALLQESNAEGPAHYTTSTTELVRSDAEALAHRLERRVGRLPSAPMAAHASDDGHTCESDVYRADSLLEVYAGVADDAVARSVFAQTTIIAVSDGKCHHRAVQRHQARFVWVSRQHHPPGRLQDLGQDGNHALSPIRTVSRRDREELARAIGDVVNSVATAAPEVAVVARLWVPPVSSSSSASQRLSHSDHPLSSSSPPPSCQCVVM